MPNVFGEPHIITLDGVSYGFQAAGEFIVAASIDGTVQVQSRFEPAGASTTVTRATALAVNVNGDRVAFYASTERPLVVNGEVIDRTEYARTLPGGGVIERHGTEAFVTWPDGTTLTAHVYARFINFGLDPSDAVGTSLVGIIGNRDGDPGNDLATRGGQVIDREDPAFRNVLYGEFASSWRISQEESLFDYLPGESTATFTRPEIPTAPATIDALDPAQRAEAEKLCRAMGVVAEPVLGACILDVGLTGDPTYAASAATVAVALQTGVAPVLEGTPTEVGLTIEATLAAGTVDRYTFSASAGQIVYLDALGDCVDDLWWRLLRPDGALTTFQKICTDLGRRVLDVDGQWAIEIFSESGAGGQYSFTTIAVPEVEELSLIVGQTVSGATSAIGEWDRYTFNASAGQIIYFDALGDCVDELWVRLLLPDGTLSSFK
jgi:hypothetical protein